MAEKRQVKLKKSKYNSEKASSENSGIIDSTLGVASTEVVDRYGRAANEFIRGYTGKNSTNGDVVEKGLKQIAQSKVHPDFEYQNLKQQAGFAAEVHYENRTNAQNIINRSNQRIARTDKLGMTNHTKYDLLAVDTDGNPITKSDGPLWGAQMKFCGKYGSEEEIKQAAEALAKKLAGDSWERYRGNDILVPKEQYDEIVKYSSNEAKSLWSQAEVFKKNGNLDKAFELEERAKKYDQVSKDVKNSGISSKDAMFLREHSELATAKYVLKTAHDAGIEQAKIGAMLTGVLSTAKNIVSVATGDKELSEAIKDTGHDTIVGASTSYVIASAGTAIKGFMTNSSKEVFVNLSKTNMPAMIATVIVQVGKSLHSYAKGDIDELELAEELGEKGTGMLAASWGAAIGTAVFPGVGTVVGGMIGYMTSSILYQSAISTLNEEQISQEKMNKIHELSKIAQATMLTYQNELNALIDDYYNERAEKFHQSFQLINESMQLNDMDLMTKGLNKIALEMGSSLKFKSFSEFDSFMLDTDTVLEL